MPLLLHYSKQRMNFVEKVETRELLEATLGQNTQFSPGGRLRTPWRESYGFFLEVPKLVLHMFCSRTLKNRISNLTLGVFFRNQSLE